MFVMESPEKALIDYGHQRLEALEEALEENRKILLEELESSKDVEAIATAATLQLFNMEKLVEEEVTEADNNLDYIENLLDNRVEREVVVVAGEGLQSEDPKDEFEKEEDEVLETLRLALSEGDDEGWSKDEGVVEEEMVFSKVNVGEAMVCEDGMEKEVKVDVKIQEEGKDSSRKRKREEEDDEVDGNTAKRFCSWRTWVADIFSSWFSFNFEYFVELYNGLSDVFVRAT